MNKGKRMTILLPYSFLPEIGPAGLLGDGFSRPLPPDQRVATRVRSAAEIVGLSQVVKFFDGPGGRIRALDGVDLSIQRGEIFGIIGPSGAGKSTLIRCINLLERPSAGQILIDGEAVQDLPPGRLAPLRRKIGMIFQHFNLLSSRTVFDNVALPMRLAGRRAWEIANRVPELLELVGLTDKRDVYPAKLSGGQKQRVGIARALALQPEVLLCDEATSALDPATTLQILALIKDVNRQLGVTVILITHEMGVLREICDRLAVLEAGRIVEQGPVFDIFTRASSPVTRRLLQGVVPALPDFISSQLTPTLDGPSDAIVRLQFGGRAALDPVVADFARDHGVPFSVIHGSIDYIQERPTGVLYLALRPSAPEQLVRLIAYLKSRVLDVEFLGYVPRPA
jgi:D-methionine transport system ATP-binding protein